MGNAYASRNDDANNIADGNIINAADFDGEFDAIVNAFATNGHTHSGAAGEGGPIQKLGPSQEVEVDSGAIFPASDGVTDLGKTTKEWKDLYIDGVINTDNMSADAATITGNASVGGTFNVGGATTLTGAASLSNTLAVSAASAFKGAVSVESTLAVTGDTDVSNLSASGTLDVAGSATFSNNVTVNANLAVGDIVASAIQTGAASTFSAKTTFTTDATVGGTFAVGGTTNLATANITGTVNVTGDTTLDNVSANGTLDVSGNGSVGGTFNVEGDLKNNAGNLTVAPTSYILEVKGGGSTEGQIQLNCAVNSHGQKITAADHSLAATNTLTLPGGSTIGNSDATLVSDTGTQTLTNKTLTSPAINGATIDSAVSVSSAGTLNAGTNADIQGTLDVGSNASVGGTFTITGSVSAASTLNVGGNFSGKGTFNVAGSATLSGNVTMGDATADITIVNSQVEFKNNLRERTSISTTSATGTINFDILSHNVELRTNDAAANFELNFRGNSGTTFASTVAVGQTTSFAFESSMGSTAYYLTAIKIDGATASPVHWQGGTTAPSEGNADGIDSYLINITRGADGGSGTAQYTCLASQTQYGKVTY